MISGRERQPRRHETRRTIIKSKTVKLRITIILKDLLSE